MLSRFDYTVIRELSCVGAAKGGYIVMHGYLYDFKTAPLTSPPYCWIPSFSSSAPSGCWVPPTCSSSSAAVTTPTQFKSRVIGLEQFGACAALGACAAFPPLSSPVGGSRCFVEDLTWNKVQ
jgi:hypothetical protein